MTREHAGSVARPPRWAERVAGFFISPRDREAILGDLLEEYRELALPVHGSFGADVWYGRQVVSLALGNPVRFGIVLGALFGAWNLGYALLFPLTDDSVIALLAFYGPMFLIPGIAGFTAFRTTARWREAVRAAVTVAVITQFVFGIANLARVNLLLDVLSRRADWQNLVSRFDASDVESFRQYVNYDYATQFAPKLVATSLIATVCGILGGMFSAVFRARGSRRRANTPAACLGWTLVVAAPLAATVRAQPPVQSVDLAQRRADGGLRAVSRDVQVLPGQVRGVRVSERAGAGVVWIDGTDFAEGTIELAVRGRDVPQRSFVGVAFHRTG